MADSQVPFYDVPGYMFINWANNTIRDLGSKFSGSGSQPAPAQQKTDNNAGQTPSQITSQNDVYNPTINGKDVSPYVQTTVKPTTTNNGGGGGGGSAASQSKADADWAKYHPNEGARPAGYNGEGGGGGQPDFSQQINEMYQPYLDSLNTMKQNVITGNQEDQNLITDQYNANQQKINNQGNDLQSNLNEQVRGLAESFQSAVTDAIRSYNQLKQQAQSKYGMGSSLGQALQGLASNEFYRQQGGLYKQKITGEQQASQEQTRIKSFITEKLTDLDSWKRDATTKLQQNFRDRLAEIEGRRGDIEANKTKDKMNLLQQAYNQAQQITLADQQFRQGLASYAVQSLANIQGTSFDPAQIPKVVGDVMTSVIPGISQGGAGGTGQYYLNARGQKVDEYGNLIQ